MTPRRIVRDTNVIISRLLSRKSVPAQAVGLALAQDRILTSDTTSMELADVLSRAKFDAQVTVGERQDFLRRFNRIAERVEIIRPLRVCRDPKDDKFLELAVEGDAEIIVTGDGDLLAHNPFQGISIVTPTRFLEMSIQEFCWRPASLPPLVILRQP